MSDARSEETWQLVAHAHVRFRDGLVVAGAPGAADHVGLPDPWGILAWRGLQHPGTIEDLAVACGAAHSDVTALVASLHEAGLVTRSSPESAPGQGLAFHDALLHSRSRGITDEGFGKASGLALAAERIRGDRLPLAVPPNPSALDDQHFGDVLSRRRTTRDWSTEDLPIDHLAALLWFSARATDGSGEHFPYPYAGPARSTGILIAAGRVDGLAPALYAYDASSHALSALPRAERRDRSRLPVGDYITTVASGNRPGDRHPHAMLIVTADLTAMTSSYDGIAYANTLKTAGAVLATFSLAAAALGLGSTILGLASDADTREIFDDSASRSAPVAEMALGLPRGVGD